MFVTWGLSPGTMLGCGSSKERLLLASAHCSLAAEAPQLSSVCSELSLLHTHTELCLGCADLSRSPGLPWRCLPATPHQLVFLPSFISLLLGFSSGQACLSGMRRSCCGWFECWFCEFLTHRKVPAAQDMHTLKCVFMNLKWQTFFSLGVLFSDFFFSQISPVMSWSFDSPPDKTVPVREAVLWDSFWKLFREITVGFLRKLVRTWKDHRKVFSLKILSRILWREGKNPTPSNERIFWIMK